MTKRDKKHDPKAKGLSVRDVMTDPKKEKSLIKPFHDVRNLNKWMYEQENESWTLGF